LSLSLAISIRIDVDEIAKQGKFIFRLNKKPHMAEIVVTLFLTSTAISTMCDFLFNQNMARLLCCSITNMFQLPPRGATFMPSRGAPSSSSFQKKDSLQGKLSGREMRTVIQPCWSHQYLCTL
jgi:hypothetical protein